MLFKHYKSGHFQKHYRDAKEDEQAARELKKRFEIECRVSSLFHHLNAAVDKTAQFRAWWAIYCVCYIVQELAIPAFDLCAKVMLKTVKDGKYYLWPGTLDRVQASLDALKEAHKRLEPECKSGSK